MKKIKELLPLIILGFILSMSVASCINNDDNTSGLTDEEKKNCVAKMSGTYQGKIYYFDKNIDKTKYPSQTDSIENATVRFSYPESAFVIEDFPVKLLFKQISNHDDLKAAAEEYGNTDIKVTYIPYSTQGNYQYIVYYNQPQTISMTLNYGNLNHDVKVAFMLNNYGEWYNSKAHFQLVEGAIYVDYDSKGEPELLDGKALYNQNLSEEDSKDLIFEFLGKLK